jgi:CAAX protease family protein
MPPRSLAAPLWLAAALFPLVASQFVRLRQADPAAWIFWDYAGRAGALAVLAVVASARVVAFRRQRVGIAWWEAALWIVGLVLVDRYLGGWIRRAINTVLPGTMFGVYPDAYGLLHFVDVVLGFALVAFSEEILFRRYARHAFQTFLGDGLAMVIVTSLLFAAYHWWAGVGVMAEAALMGALLMVFYRRSGALWPVALGHYAVDIADFA